jgi:hypothetical protein
MTMMALSRRTGLTKRRRADLAVSNKAAWLHAR